MRCLAPMIKINSQQKGNGLITYLNYSSYVFEDKLSTDYEINDSISVLFLSLRFHSCKPEYIYKRLNKLKPYKLSVLLLLIDADTYNNTILEFLERLNITLIVAYTNEECARYLRGFDVNTNRSVNTIRRKDYDHKTFLSSFKKLNKNDVENILGNTNTLKEALLNINNNVKPIGGISDAKVEEIKKYLHMSFKPTENKNG